MTSYSASCPVCGYEHDFTNKQEMERSYRRWVKAAKLLVLTALPDVPARGAVAPLWKAGR